MFITTSKNTHAYGTNLTVNDNSINSLTTGPHQVIHRCFLSIANWAVTTTLSSSTITIPGKVICLLIHFNVRTPTICHPHTSWTINDPVGCELTAKKSSPFNSSSNHVHSASVVVILSISKIIHPQTTIPSTTCTAHWRITSVHWLSPPIFLPIHVTVLHCQSVYVFAHSTGMSWAQSLGWIEAIGPLGTTISWATSQVGGEITVVGSFVAVRICAIVDGSGCCGAKYHRLPARTSTKSKSKTNVRFIFVMGNSEKYKTSTGDGTDSEDACKRS